MGACPGVYSILDASRGVRAGWLRWNRLTLQSRFGRARRPLWRQWPSASTRSTAGCARSAGSGCAPSASTTRCATALANEVFLKLLARDPDRARNPEGATRWFISNAVVAIREVLVDHARGRLRKKRGGGRARLSLDSLELDALEAPRPEAIGPEAIGLEPDLAAHPNRRRALDGTRDRLGRASGDRGVALLRGPHVRADRRAGADARDVGPP